MRLTAATEAEMRLAPGIVTEPCGTQAFSVRFSPDDAFVAAAGAQGKVALFVRCIGDHDATHTLRRVRSCRA